MSFEPESLVDLLSDTIGCKVGLAISIKQICDLLSGTKYPDLILTSEKRDIRIRPEEYEDLYYEEK
jgi:restriction system protein